MLLAVEIKVYKWKELERIAIIPQDGLSVNFEDVAIRVLKKIGLKLTNNNLVPGHRLANANNTIIKVFNKKNAEQLMTKK